MKVCIVVPVYNERSRAVDTVKKILKFSKSLVVVVDDGSSDDSYKLLNDEFGGICRVRILRHMINLGKGAAMKTGVAMAWKLRAEAVIFIDSDGQHNPKYLPEFEKALEESNLVFGYRDFDGRMPYVRRWGNKMVVVLVRQMFNVRRKDLLCGFFAFRSEIYDKIYWDSSRYGVETEIATRVGKNKLDFSELKIDTIYLDEYKGVSFLDAVRILSSIPFWFFRK